jgi:hypothetical protein
MNDRMFVFNDLHAIMICAGLNTEESLMSAKQLLASLEHTANSLVPNATTATATTYSRTSHLGVSVCKALLAFPAEQWVEAVANLTGVNEQLCVIGGSHAQRDVFWQTYLAAVDGLKNQAINQRTKYRTGKF